MIKIEIPESEIEFSFVRSSGPGGQNVNKVNSKAVLRWNVLQSCALPEELRDYILGRLEPYMTRSGDVVITSNTYRDQIRNRMDCKEKLIALVRAAGFKPKTRKKTKPSQSSRRRAKERKTQHSTKKKMRAKLTF